MLVEIKEFDKATVKNPCVIEGFPGIGMVGTISASYLTEKLGMKLVGYIVSTHFPPVSTIHDYRPVSPARVYASPEKGLYVLFSEFMIPSDVVYSLSHAIVEWAKKKKAKAIYSLAGVASPEPKPVIHGIPSNDEMAGLLKKNGVELIKEGATQGVSGVLIAECASQNFPAANLLAETNVALDPRAAARALDCLSKLLGTEIDTKELLREAGKVEAKMREAVEKMKSLQTEYANREQNPMYA